jgi:hypothetical protein
MRDIVNGAGCILRGEQLRKSILAQQLIKRMSQASKRDRAPDQIRCTGHHALNPADRPKTNLQQGRYGAARRAMDFEAWRQRANSLQRGI